jgi:hypothetical protein
MDIFDDHSLYNFKNIKYKIKIKIFYIKKHLKFTKSLLVLQIMVFSILYINYHIKLYLTVSLCNQLLLEQQPRTPCVSFSKWERCFVTFSSNVDGCVLASNVVLANSSAHLQHHQQNGMYIVF